MAFQSVRKFVSVRKPTKKSGSLLSLSITERGFNSARERRYAVSFLLHADLIRQMNWDQETKIDVLVDSEQQMGMLRKEVVGFSISIPAKKENSGCKLDHGYIKLTLPESFDYIPKDTKRLGLTIIEAGNDQVVFEMPKITLAEVPCPPVENLKLFESSESGSDHAGIETDSTEDSLITASDIPKIMWNGMSDDERSEFLTWLANDA